jgi:Bardet-Biedl syndrome 1 protein
LIWNWFGPVQGAASFTSSANLAVNAGVQGLGPRFKVSLLLKNDGQKAISNLLVKLMYNEALYEADKRTVLIPLLVPSLQYVTEVRPLPFTLCLVRFRFRFVLHS